MPCSPKPLLITIPTKHQLLLQELRNSTNVLSLQPLTRNLTIFPWPLEGEGRLPPEFWREHRDTHEFLGPCCFCSVFVTKDRAVFTEAAVYIATSGRFSSQYVAQCAKGECGYLVPLEEKFDRPGVVSKRYSLRVPGKARPPQVYHHSELEWELRWRQQGTHPGQLGSYALSKRTLKRTYAQTDFTKSPNWRRFRRVDSIHRPGLPEPEFLQLLVKCDACTLVTTRAVFDHHDCDTEEIYETDPEITDPEMYEGDTEIYLTDEDI